jgi:hypothetical protein
MSTAILRPCDRKRGGMVLRAYFPVAVTRAGAAMLTPLGGHCIGRQQGAQRAREHGYEGIRLDRSLLSFAR